MIFTLMVSWIPWVSPSGAKCLVRVGVGWQEFRRGFTYNGSLLRPAMVGVAAPPEEAEVDANDSVDLSM